MVRESAVGTSWLEGRSVPTVYPSRLPAGAKKLVHVSFVNISRTEITIEEWLVSVTQGIRYPIDWQFESAQREIALV